MENKIKISFFDKEENKEIIFDDFYIAKEYDDRRGKFAYRLGCDIGYIHDDYLNPDNCRKADDIYIKED